MKAFVKAVLGASVSPTLALSIIVLGSTGVAGASLAFASYNPYVASSTLVTAHKPVVTAQANLMSDLALVPGQVLAASTSVCAGGDTVVRFIFQGNPTVFVLTQNAQGQNILYPFTNSAIFSSWYCSSAPAGTAAQEGLVQINTPVPAAQAGCSDPLSQIKGTCGTAATGTGSQTVTTQPRVGQLVSSVCPVATPNCKKTVYLVGNNGLYGFPDLTTFESWGYNPDFSQVVPENSAEQNLQYITTVPMAQSGCTSPLSQIAGTCGNNNGSGNSGVATLTFMPATAQAGSVVTVTASTNNNNTVTPAPFGPNNDAVCLSQNGLSRGCVANLTPLYSSNYELQFTLPSPLAAGTYNITVESPNTYIPNYTGTLYVSASTAAVTYLSEICPSTSPVGSTVTITGSGFTSSNIVSFSDNEANNTKGLNNNQNGAGIIVTNLPSTNNGTTLQFTVPQLPAGVYPVSVSNSNGRTGDVAFTVGSSTSGCNSAPYITSLSSQSGAVGSTITINGGGFSANGLEVDFGSPAVPQATTTATIVTSSDGSASGLKVVIPSSLQAGSLPVIVKNANGFSNQVGFAITSGNMTITNSPATASPGGTVTVTGNGFTSSNTVYFANSPINNVSSTDGKTLQFTVPGSISVGSYYFTVTNTNGQQSNQVPLKIVAGSVYVSASFGANSNAGGGDTWGKTGAVSGSGFTTTSGNTINFPGTSIPSITNIASTNGTSLSFTIPNTIPLSNNNSSTKAMQSFTVSNANGTSNPMPFYLNGCNALINTINGVSSLSSGISPSVQLTSSGSNLALTGQCFAAAGNTATLTVYDGLYSDVVLSTITVNNLTSVDGTTMQLPLPTSLYNLVAPVLASGNVGTSKIIVAVSMNNGYGDSAAIWGSATGRESFQITSTATGSGSGSAPVISFAASLTSITAGQSSSLSWTISGVPTSVSLSSNPTSQISYSPAGPVSVSPTVTTVYTLTASNSFGSVSKSVTITVGTGSGAGTLPTVSFNASPIFITSGQPVQLAWNVTGSNSITIDNGVGAQTNLSSSYVRVYPTVTTTYTLTATNGSGSTKSNPVTVTVSQGSGNTPVVIKETNRNDSGFYACGTGFSNVTAEVTWAYKDGTVQTPIPFTVGGTAPYYLIPYTDTNQNPPNPYPICVFIPIASNYQALLGNGWTAKFTLYNSVIGISSAYSVDITPNGFNSSPQQLANP